MSSRSPTVGASRFRPREKARESFLQTVNAALTLARFPCQASMTKPTFDPAAERNLRCRRSGCSASPVQLPTPSRLRAHIFRHIQKGVAALVQGHQGSMAKPEPMFPPQGFEYYCFTP
ncbi:hypothetical protein MAPG_00020 [Magnaporthiopsis poae ATCC 64411]|uniref:Uncharacterized protein n=1 Tax=Magnaporthiopsis poae (strain ATCC 64411 / 73-15) TaxID=644358 RepID=A0A0C4DJW1_MAGP6|nr:hypothetical protein MAPG_00020 [Magnaporthiopsis poae ATCC 64411]